MIHIIGVILVYLATFVGMFISQYQMAVLLHHDIGVQFQKWQFMLLAIGALGIVIKDEMNRKGMSRDDFRSGKLRNLDRRLISAFNMGWVSSGMATSLSMVTG